MYQVAGAHVRRHIIRVHTYYIILYISKSTFSVSNRVCISIYLHMCVCGVRTSPELQYNTFRKERLERYLNNTVCVCI